MKSVLIKNAKIVNEGTIFEGDVLIENEFIVEIAETISAKSSATKIINAEIGDFLTIARKAKGKNEMLILYSKAESH